MYMKIATMKFLMGLMIVVAGSILTGCETPGESGVLEFDDKSVYPGKFAETLKVGVNTRIAVGSTVEWKPSVRFFGAKKSGKFSSAVDDPSIFSVVAGGGTVVLRAEKPGTTHVTVTSNTGVHDRLQITAVEAAELKMIIRSDRLPLAGWGTGKPFTDEGYALMPNATFEVGVRLLDGNGSLLAGKGSVDFVTTQGDATVEPSKFANSQKMIAANKDLVVSASAGLTQAMALPVVNDPAELTLDLFSLGKEWDEFIVMDELVRTTGASPLYTVNLFDAAGRLVIPSEKGGVEIEIIEGPECLAVHVDQNTEALNGAFTFHSCQGQGIIRVDFMGVHRDFPIEVSPKQNPFAPKPCEKCPEVDTVPAPEESESET
jgi:hypothetical protein